jgi:hypothetical protein
MNTTANRERFRETMRYRRRHLSSRRTHFCRLLAQQIEAEGRPKAKTNRKLRNIEREIREFNDLAADLGIQTIRT